MFKRLSLSVFMILTASSFAFAAIPLITDDTATQGEGHFQFELFGEYAEDCEAQITTKTSDLSATLTYGITDAVDVSLGIPYEFCRSEDSESVARGSGIGDLSLDVKWRFYEKEGLSLALKPGLTIPTGDDDNGLGAGKPTYHVIFVATKQMKSWEVDMNAGYLYNKNSVNERKNIWSVSLDGQLEVLKDLKLALDAGVAANTDSSSNAPPAYILGGLIWSLKKTLDIGLGVKGGLTKPEPDITFRGGITWRF